MRNTERDRTWKWKGSERYTVLVLGVLVLGLLLGVIFLWQPSFPVPCVVLVSFSIFSSSSVVFVCPPFPPRDQGPHFLKRYCCQIFANDSGGVCVCKCR